MQTSKRTNTKQSSRAAQFNSARSFTKLSNQGNRADRVGDILQFNYLNNSFSQLAKKFSFVGRRRKKTDFTILILVAVLIAIGTMTLYAIGPAVLKRTGGGLGRQSIFLAIGVAGMLTAYKFKRLDVFVRYAPALLLASLILCFLILTPLGREVYGGRRWLDLGPISMQPSELLKASLVFFISGVAYIFAGKDTGSGKLNQVRARSARQHQRSPVATGVQIKFLLAIFCVVGLFILILQRDLGTTLVIAVISLFILIKSGTNKRVIYTLATVGLVFFLLSILMFGYRRERVLSFLRSNDSSIQVAARDQTPAEYHLEQSLIGIGSGGLLGKGLGKSVQSFGYLPEAPSDSIFAVYAEKFGLVGSLVLLALFGTLILRIIDLSYRLDGYWSLIAVGIAGWLLGNFAVNMGSILGIIPFTGVPLPFFSLGGTNLVIILFMIGVVLNLSTQSSRS